MPRILLTSFLLVVLLFVGVLPVSASPEPPVAAATTVAPAAQPGMREYLVLPAEPLAEPGQDADLLFGRLQPELAAAARNGRLAAFGVAPELGAVLLVNPAPDLLAEARGWAGVAAVLPPARP